jgi:hypothetical protein
VDATDLEKRLEARLSAVFGTHGKWVESFSAGSVYLNYRTVRTSGRARATVEQESAAWFREQPHILTVYTRSQLLAPGKLDEIGGKVRASFHPDRSGDVFPVVKPYHLLGKGAAGTTHGSPHPYDTHVPLVVFGAGVVPGIHDELVSPQAAAVILAHSIGQRMPASDVAVPAGLFAAETGPPLAAPPKLAATR